MGKLNMGKGAKKSAPIKKKPSQTKKDS